MVDGGEKKRETWYFVQRARLSRRNSEEVVRREHAIPNRCVNHTRTGLMFFSVIVMKVAVTSSEHLYIIAKFFISK